MDYGSLVISLDFELMWGILDHDNPMDYKDNLAGVWKVVPETLRLFEEYHIHATWGIVGQLANKNIGECKENIPKILPKYEDKNLSAYAHFAELEKCDLKYLFAPELIKKISNTKHQEIGTHTYSHYYCSEKGQSKAEFVHDLKKAREVLSEYNGNVTSLILPRNQVNEKYLDVMRTEGFINYRGNEKTWVYAPCGKKQSKGLARRFLRLLDSYIGMAGCHCYDYSEVPDAYGLNNVRSSCFFRPYSKKLFFLESIRMHRIKKQMNYAAVHHKVFHIWWHPHNFGVNRKENFNNLRKLVRHYEFLNERYGMKSLSMGELGNRIREGD